MKHLLLTLVVFFVAYQSNAQNAKNKTSEEKVKTTSKKKEVKPTTPAIIYDKAEIKFDSTSHDFKEVFEGVDAIYVFTFYNIGKEPLTISDARPGCSCTVSDFTHEPVMPGKSGTITVKYATHGRVGAFTKSITVTSNASISPVVTLIISGNVIAGPQEVH